MRKVWWVLVIALLGAALIVGTATARKYKSRHDQDHGAFLGVSTESVTPRLADRKDLAVDYGALIERVYDDTPADEAGLEEGDVIVELNGTKIGDSDDLSDVLDDLEAGDEAKLVVRRGKDTLEKTVELGDQSDFFKNWQFPSNIGALVMPRPGRAPRAPQAYWYNPDRTYIGIGMMDLTRQLGDYFGVSKSRGVLITEVEKDSPAEAAGLKAGDVIIRVDDDRIYDSQDIQDIVSEADAGDTLKVGIMRDKKEMQVEVTVDRRDDGYGYDNRWGSITIPRIDIPDINVQVPNMSQFWSDDDVVTSYGYNSREFRDQMAKLKDELRGLKEELHKELREQNVH